jgi:hypothetical protein
MIFFKNVLASCMSKFDFGGGGGRNFAKFFKSQIWKKQKQKPGPKSWNYYAENDLKI